MNNNSLDLDVNNLDSRKIIISNELSLEYYIPEILDVLNKRHTWAGSLHQLMGNDEYWLKKNIVEWMWRELSCEQLQELKGRLQTILHSSKKVIPEVLLFKSLVDKEMARRNELMDRYLDLFHETPFSEVKKTVLFQQLMFDCKNDGAFGSMSDGLLQFIFFDKMRKYLSIGNVQSENMGELELLLNDSDKVLYHLANREDKVVYDAMMMMILYERFISEFTCTKPLFKFIRKLEEALQKMRDCADKFQKSLLPVFTMKHDKIAIICDLFNGQLFKNYCHSVSRVTSLYYSFLSHWDVIHAHFPALQRDQASPLKFIGLIPYHKKELEVLKSNNPPRNDLDKALVNVKTILSRWFNH